MLESLLQDPLWQQAAVAPLDQAAMTATIAAGEARVARIARAWDAYHGILPDPLTVEAYEPRDLVKVNRGQGVVMLSVHYLFGTPPGWDVPQGEDAPEDETPLEAWIAACLDAAQWQQQLLDWAINGAVGGTGFLRLLPPAQDATGQPILGAFPRFQPLDPATVTIHTDQHDITRILGYTIQYNGATPDGKPAIFRQQIKPAGAAWVIVDEHKPLTGSVWTRDLVTAWPLSWPPILHCKNLPSPNDCYGAPDLTDSIIDLNNSRNFNLSNRARIDKHHGHPLVWLRNMHGRRIRSEPGYLIDLGEEGELGQQDPPPHSETAERLGREIDEAIYQESSTPPIALGRVEDATPPSGVALRLKLAPALQKTETKRALYGPALVELIRRLCELGGQGPDVHVTLSWPEIVPMDPVAERESLVLDQRLGVVSKATIAAKLGYDWAQEQENLKLEAVLDPAPDPLAAQTDANFVAKAETAKSS